jgi:signal transduction histidine kinase
MPLGPRVIIAVVLLIVAPVFGGDDALGRGRRLPYLLTPVGSHSWGAQAVPWIADVDGNGLDEIVGANETTGVVCPIRLVEKSYIEVGQINVPVDLASWQPFTFVGPADVDDDPADELLISCVIRDTLRLLCYGLGGQPDRNVAVMSGRDRAGEPWWDGRVREVRRVSLGDGRRGFAVTAGADYDASPRAVLLFDEAFERELWRYEGGTQFRSLAVADLDGDGRDEIVFGSSAPGNAAALNGTEGGASYVGVLDAAGRLLWMRKEGGDQTDTFIAAGDVTGDGRADVVSATTPENGVEPVVSRLSVRDGLTGASLGEASIPQRVGRVFAGADGRGRVRVFVSNRSGGLFSYGLEGGKLIEVASADRGVDSDIYRCVPVEGVRGSRLLIGSLDGSLSVYDADLKLLAEHRPPGPPVLGRAVFLGPYREKAGVTRLAGISDRVYLFDLGRTPLDWALLARRVAAALGVACAGALVFSSRARRWTMSSVVRPAVSWLPLRAADRENLRLDLLGEIEMGSHDKTIVTRPLRRLADVLTMAGGIGTGAEETARLARRSLESYAATSRPVLARIAELAAAVGETPELVERLRAGVGRVEQEITRLESELASGPPAPDSARRLAENADALESALQALREKVGEGYGTDVPRALADALDMCAGDLRKAGVEIESDLSAVEDGYAWVAPPDLQFLVSNLVSNAARGMRDSATRRLTVRGESKSGFVVLRFADTGCGIPEADRERIFGLGETSKEGEGGTGLFVSRKSLERLGGAVELEWSEVGKGSTFVVRMRRRTRPASSP